MSSESRAGGRWTKSVCYMCQSNCAGVRAYSENGVLLHVEGDPEACPTYGKACLKTFASAMIPDNPGRLLKPVKRTNPERGVGIDPKWVEISWEEALSIIAEKLKETREKNPLGLLLSSFDYPPYWFFFSWVAAFGGQFFFGGATLCGATHGASYPIYGSFFREADHEHCNYLILWGCQSGHLVDVMPVPAAKKMADARMRGMKLVVIDPVCTPAASKADEWVPIRPGTDAALALCWINVLINELGIYDAEFLRKYTNGPYLIGPDGYHVGDKETKKPLVWDVRKGKALPFDAVDPSDMALEGEYTVDGEKCRPAFHLLKETYKKYTPEKVSTITTIPVETIRRIAKEFGEAARIGDTIVIDGVELPYRPAGIITGKGSFAHQHSYHHCFSMELLNILIGNVNMPGGILGVATLYERRWGPKVDSNGIFISSNWYQKFGLDTYPNRRVIKPKLYSLIEISPIGCYSENWVPVVLNDPRRFGITYDIEMFIMHGVNPILNYTNPDEMVSILKKIPFIVGTNAVEVNEAMEVCDIVLPSPHFTERYDPLANPFFKFEGTGHQDWYWFYRRPIKDSPASVKFSHGVEIFIELAERAGFLKDLDETINSFCDLREPFKLDPNKRYTHVEISDRIMKDRFGPDYGVDWYEKNNTQVLVQKKTIKEAYPRPFVEGRHHIYFEHWKRAGEDLKRIVREMGIEDIWETTDYVPLLEWWPCPAYEPKGEYDLFAVNFKVCQHNSSTTWNNPWLSEVCHEFLPWIYRILINTRVAEEKGLKDGDEVYLESEEGFKVKGKIYVTECIHPECVGIAGNAGKRALGEPIAKGAGVNWNTLISALDMTRIDKEISNVDCCLRVKIYKA